MKRFLTMAVAAGVLSAASVASAQDVLVEGPGVQVGEATVLHPRVGVEAGVISNVFFEEANERIAPILRLLAGLDIASAEENRIGSDDNGRPTLAFRAGAELEYQEYLSSVDAVRDQRHLDANLIGKLHFFPQSNASFSLQDKFQRVSRPTNFESSENLNRHLNHFIARFGFHPIGRTLSADIRYENIVDYFLSEESEFADRLQQKIGLRTTWRFFPYSQAYLDGSFGFYGALGDNELDGMPYKISSNPLRIIAGVDSLISEKTTVNAYAGYANGFYESGPNYSTIVGGVDFGWRYMPVGRLVLGYSHDVHDSINANFYREHKIHLTATHAIRTNGILSAGFGVRFRGYRGVPAQVMPSDENRDDFILEANARFNWMLQDRFSLYAEYILHSVETDFRAQFMADLDDPSYIRHEAVVGAAAAF